MNPHPSDEMFLPITVEPTDGGFLAACPLFGCQAQAPTADQARAELQARLTERFETMRAGQVCEHQDAGKPDCGPIQPERCRGCPQHDRPGV